MKLHTGDLSPYSAKVRMQIYAKGISDIEFCLDPLFRKGRFSEISPIGRIPALDVGDGDIIPESEVIAEYLEEVYPEPSMLGTDPRSRAAVRTVSRIADIYLMNNIFMTLPQLSRKTRNDAIRDLFVAQITRGMGALEKHMGTGKFAVGNNMTIADCTLVPALWLCQNTVPNLDVPDPMKATTRVAAYWTKIRENEIAARVLAEMDRGMKARLEGRE
jgi:glutathione S-transferase